MIARESEERASASLASSASMLDEARAGYQSGQFSVLELADAFDAWGEIHVVALETRRTARDAELAVARELGRSLRETPAPAGAR
jgi:outer membrane protein TolC